MAVSSKNILFTMVLMLFLSISNSYSQSENEKITNLIEQKRAFNKNNKTSIVFKIQLYNGNEPEAYKMKKEFEDSFPDYSVNIIYKQPEWKTQVGPFKTKLEADKALLIIKEEYGGAIVLEDKI